MADAQHDGRAAPLTHTTDASGPNGAPPTSETPDAEQPSPGFDDTGARTVERRHMHLVHTPFF